MKFLANTKWLSFFAVLLLSFALAACGSDSAGDDMFKDMENLVVQAETLAKQDKVSMSDYQAFTEKLTSMGTKYQSQLESAEANISDADKARYEALGVRMATAIQAISTKLTQ